MHPVVESLRQTLARDPKRLLGELGERVHQLVVGMVDGRVLPRADADVLRAELLAFVRAEALPQLAARDPGEALLVLDKLAAYRVTELEDERPRLTAARDAKFPPPAAFASAELDRLRAAAAQHPNAVRIAPPAAHQHFAEELKERDLSLPNELLGLYAACDGFDLMCISDPRIPIFALLPGKSIDISDESEGYPLRAVPFEGGDSVHLALFKESETWFLVYEAEYEPIAKREFNLNALLRFAIARLNARDSSELFGGPLAWERFFEMGEAD